MNYASGGVGAATFIVTEVLKAQAGIDMVHVPYNGGGPALASILAGVTEVYGSPYTTAKPFVDEGKLIGLAVTSAERIPYLPEMPTVAETLPKYEVTTWYGLVLPPALRVRFATNYNQPWRRPSAWPKRESVSRSSGM